MKPKMTPESIIEVRPAVGHYDGFFEVVGVKKPGGGGCWCTAYRDRVPNDERGAYMASLCATEPGPGVLAYVGTSALFAAHGFTVAGPTTAHSGGRERVVMRREL